MKNSKEQFYHGMQNFFLKMKSLYPNQKSQYNLTPGADPGAWMGWLAIPSLLQKESYRIL